MSTELLGYLEEASSLDFPFVGPSVPDAVRSLFSDIYISYNQDLIPAGTENASLRMHDISWNGTTLNFKLRFPDASLLVDTTALTATIGTWGPWEVHEWNSDTVSIKAVIAGAASSTTNSGPYNLGARSVDARTKHITKITLEDAVMVDTTGAVINATPTDYDFVDDVDIVPGFNFEINTETDPEIDLTDSENPEPPPVFPQNVINVEVVPGGGQGRYPTCLDPANNELVIRTINGLRGDARGNINLELTDCYRYEREVEFDGTPPGDNPRRGVVVPGTLWLIGDCVTCSKCQDYADLYKLLRVLYLRSAAIWQRSNITHNYYKHLVVLANTLKTYMTTPEAEFRLIQQAENTYTMHVSMRTGSYTFNQVTAAVSVPAGFRVEYIKFNGWEKLPNLRQRQNDALFQTFAGLGFAANRTMPPNNQAWWSWSFKLNPIPGYNFGTGRPDPNCPTKYDLDIEIEATVTAREVLNDGTFRLRLWGPMSRAAEAKISNA